MVYLVRAQGEHCQCVRGCAWGCSAMLPPTPAQVLGEQLRRRGVCTTTSAAGSSLEGLLLGLGTGVSGSRKGWVRLESC